MVLFAHVLTHAIAGVIPVILLSRYYKVKLWTTFILYFLGGVAGILPDILGGRESAPATHSIAFSALFIIPIVVIAKLVYKKISIYLYYLTFLVSIWFGHLFFDTLDHEMPLLYPFSLVDIEYNIVRLGDPILLGLLTISALLLLIRKWNIKYLFIPIILCFTYLGLKVASMEQLKAYISNNYMVTDKATVTVYPPHEVLINTSDVLEWLQWGYDYYDTHRTVRALVPLIGDYGGGKHVNIFYPDSIANSELGCKIKDEFRSETGIETIVCSMSDKWFVYEYINGWVRAEATKEQDIISKAK